MNVIELRKISGKGEGVFATKPFQAGEVVVVGVIQKLLGKNHSHASQVGKDKYVLHAGLTSKVNHSCAPNCGVKVNGTGAHDFVAIRDIQAGEEISFDYAMRNYSIDFFFQQCACGAKKCRGKITGWKDLPREKKAEYKGFIVPYLLELEAEKKLKTAKI